MFADITITEGIITYVRMILSAIYTILSLVFMIYPGLVPGAVSSPGKSTYLLVSKEKILPPA